MLVVIQEEKYLAFINQFYKKCWQYPFPSTGRSGSLLHRRGEKHSSARVDPRRGRGVPNSTSLFVRVLKLLV